jgi:type II secretory pathway component GspD/PulD (secretin)
MMVRMRSRLRYAAAGLFWVLASVAWPAGSARAEIARVTGIALHEAAGKLQLSIMATGPLQPQLQDIQPNWIVVDLPGTALDEALGPPPQSLGLVTRVRAAQLGPNLVRVVVELIQPVKFQMTASADGTALVFNIPTEVGGRAVPERAQHAPPSAPGQPEPKLINLEVRDAEVVDVLSALAKLAGVNIVTDTEVKGRITVRLLGVTFDDALRLILDPNGLAFTTLGNNIIVAKREKFARPTIRQYRMTNISAASFAATILPVTGIKKETVVVDDATNSIFVSGTAEDQAKVVDLLARVDVPSGRLVTRVIKLQHLESATFADLLAARLPDTVTKAARIDKASNSIVLTATAAQMETVDALLQQVDNALAQVLVEAAVIEVPTSVTKNLGVAWQTATLFTVTTGANDANQFTISVTAPPITAVLNTLIQHNRARLLANPRLAVRDGETARMNIGDKIPFQLINAQGVPSLVIIEAGVKLEITPRVNGGGFITVRMHPEVSAITTPASANVPPTISTREADTSLTVKDGTPIVLAGLIRKDETSTTVKVPLLGDIPILGWLFKSVSTTTLDSEVIFVITPHILQKVGA